MKQESAETLALRALAWLAADPEAMQGFLGATGASPADLPQLAAEAAFLAAVLDHLLQEDARVIAFCDAESVPYTLPMQARAVLAGGAAWHWT
jgi:hypothetical protein